MSQLEIHTVTSANPVPPWSDCDADCDLVEDIPGLFFAIENLPGGAAFPYRAGTAFLSARGRGAAYRGDAAPAGHQRLSGTSATVSAMTTPPAVTRVFLRVEYADKTADEFEAYHPVGPELTVGRPNMGLAFNAAIPVDMLPPGTFNVAEVELRFEASRSLPPGQAPFVMRTGLPAHEWGDLQHAGGAQDSGSAGC